MLDQCDQCWEKLIRFQLGCFTWQYMCESWGLMDLNSNSSPKTFAYLRRMQARPAMKSVEKYAEVAPGIYGRDCASII